MASGVHIQTVANPVLYTRAQINHAAFVASVLDRGKFILCTAPERS
jgi:hypothetical protein